MIERLIRALIALVVVVVAVYLVLWVLAQLGIVLPSIVVNAIWIIVVLLAILWLWRAFGSGVNWRL